ncbi:hypothetical protein F5146DRAFT_1125313 [Armillaria mellea]|nr:hypothetical protein F5146DRAFT_1125313 [Armillaria mellea]
MFFYILALLLPLVSIAIASPLVGPSGVIVPICDALNNLTTSVTAMQNACESFHATPSKELAEDVIAFIFKIDSQLESGADVCPSATLSDMDTRTVVDTLVDTDTLAGKLLNFILTLTSDFESVCFTRKFCVAFRTIRPKKIHLMDKISACSSDKYKDQVEKINDAFLALMTKVEEAYCD